MMYNCTYKDVQWPHFSNSYFLVSVTYLCLSQPPAQRGWKGVLWWGCQVATEHLVRYFYIQTQMLILVKSKCENNLKQIHCRRQTTTGRRWCLIVFGGSPQRQWPQCSRSLAPSPWPCSWDPLASLPGTLDLLAALPIPSSSQGSTQRQRRTLGDFTNLSNCTNKPILLWSSDWH